MATLRFRHHERHRVSMRHPTNTTSLASQEVALYHKASLFLTRPHLASRRHGALAVSALSAVYGRNTIGRAHLLTCGARSKGRKPGGGRGIRRARRRSGFANASEYRRPEFSCHSERLTLGTARSIKSRRSCSAKFATCSLHSPKVEGYHLAATSKPHITTQHHGTATSTDANLPSNFHLRRRFIL